MTSSRTGLPERNTWRAGSPVRRPTTTTGENTMSTGAGAGGGQERSQVFPTALHAGLCTALRRHERPVVRLRHGRPWPARADKAVGRHVTCPASARGSRSERASAPRCWTSSTPAVRSTSVGASAIPRTAAVSPPAVRSVLLFLTSAILCCAIALSGGTGSLPSAVSDSSCSSRAGGWSGSIGTPASTRRAACAVSSSLTDQAQPAS
jgi:hypothetical protein